MSKTFVVFILDVILVVGTGLAVVHRILHLGRCFIVYLSTDLLSPFLYDTVFSFIHVLLQQLSQ